MTGVVEKTMLLGLGALTLTREKVAKFVDELVKEGEVKAEESRSLADALIDKGRAEREALRDLIRQEMARVRPVPRQEFEALAQQVKDLTAQVEDLAGEKTEE